MEMGHPLWRETHNSVEGWSMIGCSEFLLRAIRFGILDYPSVLFVPGEGLELGEIPHSEEDKVLASLDFEQGLRSGIYQEVSPGHAGRERQKGAVISSSSVVGNDGKDGRKGRFVVNH